MSLEGWEFVQVKALTPKLIHGAVHMQQYTAEAVVLIWVALYSQKIQHKN